MSFYMANPSSLRAVRKRTRKSQYIEHMYYNSSLIYRISRLEAAQYTYEVDTWKLDHVTKAIYPNLCEGKEFLGYDVTMKVDNEKYVVTITCTGDGLTMLGGEIPLTFSLATSLDIVTNEKGFLMRLIYECGTRKFKQDLSPFIAPLRFLLKASTPPKIDPPELPSDLLVRDPLLPDLGTVADCGEPAAAHDGEL